MNAKFMARDNFGNEVQTAATSLEPRMRLLDTNKVQLQFVGFVHDGAVIEMSVEEFKAFRSMINQWLNDVQPR